MIAITEKHRLALIRDDPAELSRLLAKQVPMWQPGGYIVYEGDVTI